MTTSQLTLPSEREIKREDFEERASIVEEGNPGMTRTEAERLAWIFVYGEAGKA